MTYTPAYKLPDFAQSVPGDPDGYELLTPDTKKAPQLRYRDRATGQTFTVPNIPCNQQTPVRIGMLEFYLQQAREAPLSPDRWVRQSREEYIRKLETGIAELKAKIAARGQE